MRQIITTYIVVVALFALGFFGVGALAKAEGPHHPMQETISLDPPWYEPGKYGRGSLTENFFAGGRFPALTGFGKSLKRLTVRPVICG
jgi:hypothetical protein